MVSDNINNISLAELIDAGGIECDCGRPHVADTHKVLIEKGALNKLPEIIKEFGAKKVFILSGQVSYAAAGDKVCDALGKAGIAYSKYVFPVSPVAPTEHSVGSAVMHFDFSCDLILSVGSGVINDIGKILAHCTDRTYVIYATAPSMDGFASATSSMECDGLKVSLDSKAADAIIGDLDVLREAPMHMLLSGVGDMLAKYISLCEWRIAKIIVDEYYCPTVAALVENALKKVVDAAPALIHRDEEAVRSVMEGMVIAGMAMKYAGLSRPASGMEHYFSHVWDMRSLAFEDAKADLHGIQCGIATLYSLKIYEFIRSVKPDRERALAYAEAFSVEDWNRKLSAFIGPGAEAMINAEKRDGKYDVQKHAQRLERIIEKWDDILAIINSLPSYESVYKMMSETGMPVSAADFGYSDEMIRTTFTMTKDIRDKYVGSRLLWDLGLLEDAAAVIG